MQLSLHECNSFENWLNLLRISEDLVFYTEAATGDVL